ncbi:late sexual development protein [Clohesyomyces aquaticus]|uniref:Late sexual development protein n=1 Tax=Clohesyomyces aquaticus TaxID=1231657 RepID=A0A1Y1ZUC9_9PLEO|nr:late sexual development protein [Clohesyomyces aquaticus]
MRSILALSTLSLAAISVAAPAGKRSDADNGFPLDNGFPNPSADQLRIIQQQAFGTLPNGSPPARISTDGLTNIKLIALNELFEVKFFEELIYNVTNKVSGYDLGYSHEFVKDSLKAILAQEELHALNVLGALKHFGVDPIRPCKYNFPVTNFQQAIALAATFTDLVLGTLQDVNQIFAKNGDDGLVRAVSSVIGNEGEQEGFFHVLQDKRPSTLPFLTTGVRDFAFTAIQSFTIPGSCSNINSIPLKTFKPLTVVSTNIKPETQNLKFSFNAADAGTTDWNTLSVVFINQQNVPVVKSLQSPTEAGGVLTFDAAFPFEENEMNGLTIAAVTRGSGPFTSAQDVALATIFAPGLIEI